MHETLVPGFTREAALKDKALKYTDLRGARPAAASVDTLRAKAVKAGSVRVLVNVAARYAPQGILTDAEVSTQRTSIAKLQKQVTDATTPKGAKVLNTYEANVPTVAMTATPAALDALRNNAAVASIQEDVAVPPTLEQSVPQIGAADAHDRGFRGSNWTVAVLDTGADSNHEFLTGATVEEACYSAGSNCPGGTTTAFGTGAAAPCTYAASGCQHGTHVSGIAIGLATASRPNLTGVADLGLLFPIQVFSRFTGSSCVNAGEDPCPRSYTSDQLAGLNRVYDRRTAHNIAAVNMSLGGGPVNTSACDTDSLKAAIDNLRSEGIATVIASGNDGFTNGVSNPGCISTAITVGAVDKSDVVASFSNASSLVDVLAPGVSIESSIPGNQYAFFSGTSMATPHVAGAFAIMKSRTNSLSVSSGESFLETTGQGIADSKAGGLVLPRINVLRAIFQEVEIMTNDQLLNHRNPIPYAHKFQTLTTTNYWSGVAIRPPSTGDVDLDVYDVFDYTSLLASSQASGSTIDFVVQDSNRRAADYTFPLVTQYTGTGRYTIEYDNQGTSIGVGATTIAMGSSEIIEIRDSLQNAGVRTYYRAAPTNTGQDSELFLMESTSGSPSTYVQGRSSAVASSSRFGLNGNEFVNWVSPVQQYEGLVLVNKAGSGNYIVYKDDSVPTGTVSINNNAASTNTRNVNLNLSATDADTGINAFRYSFTSAANLLSQPWTLGLPSTKAVTLPAGAGNKTVWLQYRNNAFAPSATLTDTIKLNTVVTPGTASIAEGNTGTKVLNIPVTLTESSTQTVTAHWQTANHTATAPADYVAASGTVTFSPGQTSKTVPVTIKGDALDEDNENFYVAFSSPTNAVIGGAFGIGVGTITDDDPTPSIAPGSLTTVEGNAATKVVNLTVTLSHASGRTVTAHWATHNDTAIAPGDYTAASGTITFTPGQVTRTVALTIKGDAVAEANERFYVQFSAPTNATISGFAGLAPITVNNDD